jgi:predicted house-cleaning noncanonical NTP pyrophosphatase (MazG superfamily)
MVIVHNKLVRDRIPEIIEQAGKRPTVRIANEDEYRTLLQQKLIEEVNEFLESNNPEELADILEVVSALGITCGLSMNQIDKIAKGKRDSRGGFEQRIVLLSVEG